MVVPVLDLVADADLAGMEHDRRRRRGRGGDDQRLAGLLVAARDDDELVRRRDPDADEEAFVRFVIDQHVVLGRALGRAAVDLGRTTIVVPERPVDPLAVGREAEVARGALDRALQDLARSQLLHVDAVDLRPLLIDGVGVELVVRRMAGRADLVEGLALGLLLFVEQDLLGAAADRLAGMNRVLRALLEAGVVLERTVLGRNAGVVLLDATFHLLEHRRLQRFGRGEHGLGVGVLGGQVLLDVGLDQGRVPQDLLPVVVLHPGIVVDAGATQLLDGLGNLLRDRRNGASGV